MLFNKRTDFVKWINQQNKAINGVEVGVYRGQFSQFLLENCPSLHLSLVDIWVPINGFHDVGGYEECKKLELKYPGRVEIIREWSSDAASFFRDGHFQFFYLDADHSYEAVKEDTLAWLPKVSPGGLMAFHDYKNLAQSNKYVKKAIDEIFGCDKIQSTAEVAGSAWIFKSETTIPLKQEPESLVSCEVIDEETEDKTEDKAEDKTEHKTED